MNVILLYFPEAWSLDCVHLSADMDSNELIDAQFEKAVSIVQGLPKIGPIQTGYEEKLAMYRCAFD